MENSTKDKYLISNICCQIYVIINLKLNLEEGSLYGNASINSESSFEINIQEAIDVLSDEMGTLV